MARPVQIFVAALCIASCGGASDGGGGSAGGRPPPTHAVGGSVTGLRGSGLVLQINGGDALTIVADGSFAFATALPANAAYSVTVRTQPTATPTEDCSVADGTGVVGSVTVTNVKVTCRAATMGKYFYTLYFVGVGTLVPKISGFLIDQKTGTLTELPGSPFSVQMPDHEAVTGFYKSGRFLYIKGQFIEAWDALTGYSIDLATGAPTLIPGMPMARQPQTGAPFFEPSGRALYLPDEQTLIAYAIDPTSGALSRLPGPPYGFGAAYAPVTGVFSPTSATAFVTFRNYSTGGPYAAGVSAFAVDVTTGALTFEGGTDRLLHSAGEIVVHPNGKHAYFRSYNMLSVLGIENPASISVTDAPVATDPGSFNGVGSLVDAQGQYAYFQSDGGIPGFSGTTGSISAYRIDKVSGDLTPLAGSPYPTNYVGSSGFTMDPTRRFIVFYNAAMGVAVLKIDASTGALEYAPGSPFKPVIGTTPLEIIFEPSGGFAYMRDGPSFSLSAYSFDSASGRFTFIDSYPLAGRPDFAQIAGLQ
jgi:6-phosphogluconolactonase (cycloisomerase 2 family)